MFLYAGILLLISSSTQAQTKSKKNKKQTVHSKTVSSNKGLATSSATRLNTTVSYPAKANTGILSILKNNYTITDPILTTLNARAREKTFNSINLVSLVCPKELMVLLMDI